MARAFVIRPFGKKKDTSGKELDFERVHTELIGPALEAANLGGSTTGEIVEAGNIREDMFSLILEADLVVCDITIHNANVFYELGIRHALRKKRTILIKGEPTADSTPFDVLTDRYLSYGIENPASTRDRLVEMIDATLQSDRQTDSPIFRMLPTLAETDLSTVQVVPLDFREGVDRAREASSKGWLRLLAQEVRDRRFGWMGLQLVASAQWDLRDYEGARESLEAVRQTHQDDPAASLKLATIYERLYRNEKKPELLKTSDQAIERVLAGKDAPSRDRVEALALKGRNKKTRWRREFEVLGSVNERREAAMSQSLRESYEAYREAFYENLNHYYSGLNALQMGTIFLDLSEEEDGSWKAAFDDDEAAEKYRHELAKDVEVLRWLVPASVEAGLRRLSGLDPQHVWAEISKADVLFLNEQNEQRVANRYRNVIPRDNPFAWDAAKEQLGLFIRLGVKADLANKVIAAVQAEQPIQEPAADDKPVHIVVFAGHRVDDPGRAKARFPAEQEGRAKNLIRDALSELNEEYRVQALASAAPGADILFHEACDELDIPSTLCLPMPSEDYARLAFRELDDWRSRFLRLQDRKEVLELSDREGLPGWLHGADTDPWERGNRWVMEMALSSEAREITLLALWDGKDEGDAPGGTAHMVRLARNAGRVHIKRIETKRLLE
jgi:hypothetical protein